MSSHQYSALLASAEGGSASQPASFSNDGQNWSSPAASASLENPAMAAVGALTGMDGGGTNGFNALGIAASGSSFLPTAGISQLTQAGAPGPPFAFTGAPTSLQFPSVSAIQQLQQNLNSAGGQFGTMNASSSLGHQSLNLGAASEFGLAQAASRFAADHGGMAAVLGNLGMHQQQKQSVLLTASGQNAFGGLNMAEGGSTQQFALDSSLNGNLTASVPGLHGSLTSAAAAGISNQFGSLSNNQDTISAPEKTGFSMQQSDLPPFQANVGSSTSLGMPQMMNPPIEEEEEKFVANGEAKVPPDEDQPEQQNTEAEFENHGAVNDTETDEFDGKNHACEHQPATEEEGPNDCVVCLASGDEMQRCNQCNHSYHLKCHNPPLKEKIHGVWHCHSCKPRPSCTVCLVTSGKKQMRRCRQCWEWYHLQCHDPPLDSKPIGFWRCASCKNLGTLSQLRKAGGKPKQGGSAGGSGAAATAAPAPAKYAPPKHSHLPRNGVAECVVCSVSGVTKKMRRCRSCWKWYHLGCHQPPLETKPIGFWKCSDCVEAKVKPKPPPWLTDGSNPDGTGVSSSTAPPPRPAVASCSICFNTGDTKKAMRRCRDCWEWYHLKCHNPPLDSKPIGYWKCTRCKTNPKKKRKATAAPKVDSGSEDEYAASKSMKKAATKEKGFCVVCSTTEVNTKNMRRCRKCWQWYHLTCHVPALETKPIGWWKCTPCKDEEQGKPRPISRSEEDSKPKNVPIFSAEVEGQSASV